MYLNVERHIDLIDVVESFPTSTKCLIAKFGFDTAENESLKVYRDLGQS